MKQSKPTIYTYEELHALIYENIGNKQYGFLKQFCNEHKLQHSYVLNLLSHTDLRYNKLLIKIAKILGYEVTLEKEILYHFKLTQVSTFKPKFNKSLNLKRQSTPATKLKKSNTGSVT